LITRYGTEVVITVLLLSCILIAISIIFIKIIFLQYTIIFFGIAFLLFTLYFFRDPERFTPKGSNLVISPADGKIIMIKDVIEDKYIKSECKQVSIFMSPMNVHVNRIPISGTVEYFEHIDGKFLVAFEDKSSDVNERTLIGINSGSGKVFFKQIAGFIARRIVADLKVGTKVSAGERFGMIKFGSRVDVILPKNSVVYVKLNENVNAGKTILARLTNA
jgi:phosphatidylserine decarboxylase